MPFSGHLIIGIGPDIIFARFSAMGTIAGTLVPELSYLSTFLGVGLHPSLL